VYAIAWYNSVDRSAMNCSLHAGSHEMCMSIRTEITFFMHQVSFIVCTKSKIFFVFYNEDIMYYLNMF